MVALSGGIAAYRVGDVVSRMVQGGAGVTVALTRAAGRFIGVQTLQALTGRRVLTDLFGAGDPSDIQHIALTGAADLVVVAPATANLLGKLAAGIADDLVTTLLISVASPVLIAPAMNDRMWAHPIVQRNVETLKNLDYRFVGPATGRLACGTEGPGRMAEPSEILDAVGSLLRLRDPKQWTSSR